MNIKGASGKLLRTFQSDFFQNFFCVFLFQTILLVCFGHPIFDQDSLRYTSIASDGSYNRVPGHGSVMPYALNYYVTGLFGNYGIVISNLLLSSYAAAKLSELVCNLLLPVAKKTFQFLFSIALLGLSLSTLLSFIIISETGTMTCFVICLCVLVKSRLSICDAILLLILSAYHQSNLVIICTASFINAIIPLINVKRIKISLLITLLAILSFTLDSLIYNHATKYRIRTKSSFYSAIILNYYPFVLDRACQQKPELSFCQPKIKSFIESRRTPQVYQPGRFLWGGTKLANRKIPLKQFESDSNELLKIAVSLVPEYWLEYSSISINRVLALLRANSVYLFIFSDDPNTQSLLIETINGSEFKSIISSVKFLQLYLIIAALLISFLNKQFLNHKLKRVIFLIMSIYMSNLIFMGIASTAVWRYEARAQILLSTAFLIIAFRAIRIASSKSK